MNVFFAVIIAVVWYVIGFLFSVFWAYRKDFQNVIGNDVYTTELVMKSLVSSSLGIFWLVFWLIAKAMKPLNRWIWKRIGGKDSEKRSNDM